MVLETTNNYSLFTFLNSNRVINENKVRMLTNEILKHGQLVPIIVNERYEVIDGQHRVESCKRARKPITYIKQTGLTVLDAAHANTAGSNWNIADWIHYHAKQGNEHYVNLLSFIDQCKEQKIGIQGAIALAQNVTTNARYYQTIDGDLIRAHGKNYRSDMVFTGTDITLGYWKWGSKSWAQKSLDEIALFTNEYKWCRRTSMIHTLMRVNRIKALSLRKLFEKSKKYPDLFYKTGTAAQTLQMIETLYNFRVKQLYRLPIANNPELAYE